MVKPNTLIQEKLGFGNELKLNRIDIEDQLYKLYWDYNAMTTTNKTKFKNDFKTFWGKNVYERNKTKFDCLYKIYECLFEDNSKIKDLENKYKTEFDE